MNIYQGTHIFLRPLKAEDKTVTLGWHNDPEMREKSMGFRFPVSGVMEERWINSILDGTDMNRIFYIIEGRRDNTPIGFIQLYSIDWISRTARLGIAIGKSSCRGKGWGGEALRLLLDLSNTLFHLRKITVEVASYNPALGFYRHKGFQEEGRLCKHIFLNGSYHDLFILSTFLDSQIKEG